MRCDYRWPLLDPSPEDLAEGVTHHCRLDLGHGSRLSSEVDHQCACGARPGDEW
jgi:hypothetical protein